MKRILVAVDGSQLAEQVLPHIEELAKPLSAEVLLLRVVPPIQIDAATLEMGAAGYITERLETEAQQKQEAETYLAAIGERLRQRGLTVRTIVREGPVIETIAGVAEGEQVDMVALSTHGRSGLSHLLFGSVAEAVIRRVSVPVLVVRPRALRS
ncbi:MAG: universal stress protein [Chloroflexi bacterium]|nr:universal stress protein [Chloroflexota bacterium]